AAGRRAGRAAGRRTAARATALAAPLARVAAAVTVHVVMVMTAAEMMAEARVAEVLDCLPADRGARPDSDRISRVRAMHYQIAADRSFDIDGVVAAAKLRDKVSRARGAAGDRHVVVAIATAVYYASVDATCVVQSLGP